ncbi:MAG: metal-dependent transcriptional regulator [Oscillospiraceae bacterium]|nr:metal-dependent transcriptional regulator [Oscillospiraceae bacterium]MBR5260924.1 metal-dependent transcriptional regulator [Oscillospiraceae bacterium]
MKTTKSEQDYLETILTLHKKSGYVRSIDIANELSVSRPSVSVAMKKLIELGHIVMEDGGKITLTESGKAVAEEVYSRHIALTHLLMELGVSAETAEEDACRIEHDISDETFAAIKRHFQNK